MNSASIESDYLAAKAKTAITIMNANGWQQGSVNPEVMSVDSVFFYVFDHETKWIWSCSVPRDSFLKVLIDAKDVLSDGLIHCCGRLISECAASVSLDPDKENELAIALAAYTGITKTYQLTARATKANHFGIIHYGLTNTVRPFAMPGSDRHMLASSEVEGAFRQVVALDQKNHPEWSKAPAGKSHQGKAGKK